MPPAIITILIRCAEHHPQRGQRGPWLPNGGAGSPNGLTCAPAGAMQASNRRQAALSESQRGCCSMNGDSSKIPTTPPLPLRGTSPKGGSEGCATLKITPKITKGESIPPPTGRYGFAFFGFRWRFRLSAPAPGRPDRPRRRRGGRKRCPWPFWPCPAPCRWR